MSRTALAVGIPRLYHYQKFVPKYLTDVLVEKRVHCSDLSTLNDPWDCRPWFNARAGEDPTYSDKLAKWIFQSTVAEAGDDEEIKAVKEEFRSNPRSILDASSAAFPKMLAARLKVFCLTPFPDSTLMWSHYAERHKGICLEFALDNPVFGSAKEVSYLSSYPNWAPHLLKLSEPHVLLTKSDDWKYEKEYRIIAFREGFDRAVKSHPLFLEDEYLNLPTGALQAVIAGCESNFDDVTAIVKRHSPDLKIKRAVRSPTSYRLEISD